VFQKGAVFNDEALLGSKYDMLVCCVVVTVSVFGKNQNID
jgi:hypothetical protein